MTRDYANEVLFLWKVGAELFPAHVITQALYTTGDLDGPLVEADAGLVRVPGFSARVESPGLALGQRTSQGASRFLLEAAGAVGERNAEGVRT